MHDEVVSTWGTALAVTLGVCFSGEIKRLLHKFSVHCCGPGQRMIPLARSSVLFIIIIVVGSCLGVVLGGYSTEYPCHQQQSPLVVLQKDRTTGNFSVVYRLQPGEPLALPGVQVRNLVVQGNTDDVGDVHFLRQEDAAFPGIMAVDEEKNNAQIQLFRDLQAGDYATNFSVDQDAGTFYYTWECGCFNPRYPIVFCPVDIETCLQPLRQSTNQIPGCRNLPKAYDFRRYSFLITVVWFFAIMTALVTSRHGPFLFGFLVSKCFPSWNDRAVDRLLQGHPQQVRDMIRIYIIREQRALFEARRQQDMEEAAARPGNRTTTGVHEDTEERNPQERDQRSDNDYEPKSPRNSLILRTKKYARASPRITVVDEADDADASSNSDTEEDRCTICFLSLNDGDRVGSLRCNHLFHSECLKLWLPRKNACPLCQSPDIAQLRVETNLSATVGQVSANPIDGHDVDPTAANPIDSHDVDPIAVSRI